jgi:hypothetical protein
MINLRAVPSQTHEFALRADSALRIWWQRAPVTLRGAVFAAARAIVLLAGCLAAASSRSRPWRAGLLECPSVDIPVPWLVRQATARARREGFSLSCDPAAGRLLAVLAAHLPACRGPGA